VRDGAGLARVPLRGPIFLLGEHDETQFSGSGPWRPVGLTVLAPAYAENKTVTLSVPGMDCEACPITVGKALKKVDGVGKVAASLEQKSVVTFDDAKTNVDACARPPPTRVPVDGEAIDEGCDADSDRNHDDERLGT